MRADALQNPDHFFLADGALALFSLLNAERFGKISAHGRMRKIVAARGQKGFSFAAPVLIIAA
jgi:hypothetical protein